MADIGDFSLSTPENTVLPALKARLAQMEEEIRRSHKQLAQMSEQLMEAQMLVATLSMNWNTQLKAKESEVPAWRCDIDAGFKSPKMAKPDPFTGWMDDTELFINACWMFICRHPNDFPSERMAIMWAISYINQGSAREWHDDYLEDAKGGNYRFETLQAFFNAVQEEFGDPDRQSTKTYKLHTIVQGDRTADEHVQHFKKAACGSGYSGYALVEEFKCLLNAQLRE